MASVLSSVPRGTFRLHAAQLRHASNTTTALANTQHAAQLSLFKPPSSIISPWRCITGAQEWQTSTYSYNKSTTRTLPTASLAADKLLRDFSTAIPSRGLASTGSSSTARSAVAQRRKRWEKTFVSGTTVKDFGDRIVVNAVLFDAAEAEAEERKRKFKEMQESKKAGRGKGGAGGGRRRGPGGAAGARRPMGRTGGAMGGYGGAAPGLRAGGRYGGGSGGGSYGQGPPGVRSGAPGGGGGRYGGGSGGGSYGQGPPGVRSGAPGGGGGSYGRSVPAARNGAPGATTGFETGIKTLRFGPASQRST
ncbi:hypothetical protein B0A54_04383 [Friedmanniomyces endolithicus]|uniref:Uncharacterized protein n=1 Tax=Friedmanniomyces endolithicus TaxID=329885 RepID=A0A4U0V905_9PEZI|nr:hypothetical protein B0A54_04383 [Friedmanniomyces endolithicus]